MNSERRGNLLVFLVLIPVLVGALPRSAHYALWAVQEKGRRKDLKRIEETVAQLSALAEKWQWTE